MRILRVDLFNGERAESATFNLFHPGIRTSGSTAQMTGNPCPAKQGGTARCSSPAQCSPFCRRS